MSITTIPPLEESWSLLSTTSLSGTTTTISNIPLKNRLLVFFSNISVNTSSNSTYSFRVNSNDSGIYNSHSQGILADATYSSGNFFRSDGFGGSAITLARSRSNELGGVDGYLFINATKSSGVKPFWGLGNFGDTGSAGRFFGGYINTSAVISSVSFICNTGSFDAGTIYIVGSDV
jgi:hypothetical protein